LTGRRCGTRSLLLSSSGEQHDWDIDDEAREYIREREALRNLDATAIVGCAVGDDLTTGISQQQQQQQQEESFLKRRVALQRQILARRLGLGGILNAPILVDGHHDRAPKKGIGLSSGIKKRSRIIDNIVDDEDSVRVVNVSLSISSSWQRRGAVGRRWALLCKEDAKGGVELVHH
jgi:hypothetical protein